MAHIQPPIIIHSHPSPPPCPSPPITLVAGKRISDTTTHHHPVHKTLATAANLANLLPTGTVLAFRTLTPPFSNKGSCQPANVCLTACLIFFCAVFCFFSTFIDTFRDSDGKIYYGTATFKGLYLFNGRSYGNRKRRESPEEHGEEKEEYLSEFKIGAIDFLHAIVSVLVFLIFALSDSDVQRCFLPEAGENMKVLMMNLPMGAGVFSSSLFVLFPTKRRGIGYADLPC